MLERLGVGLSIPEPVSRIINNILDETPRYSRYLRSNVIQGSAYGLAFYLADRALEFFIYAKNDIKQMSGILTDNTFIDPILSTITSHPLETIAVGAGIGLAVDGYKLYQRRFL